MEASFNLLRTGMLLLAFCVFSCNPVTNLDGDVDPTLATDLNLTTEAVTSPFCGSSSYTLWAGQTINGGALTVSNDADSLYVTYSTSFSFGTLHLWVGTDMTLLPVNGQGVPIPGHFPYAQDTNGGTEYTFSIPLGSIPYLADASGKLCDKSISVVAHAEVTINGEHETAWGGNEAAPGPQIPGSGRWAYYGTYQVACCATPPPPATQKLGTGFAKGTYIFTTDPKSNPERLASLKLTKNRWGWAINVTAEGTTTHDVWVGAGLNNTTKALKVGTVTITNSAGSLTVTYNLTGSYVMEEAHIYANDFKPSTIAPGQYGHTAYFDPFANTYSYTTTATDTNGDGIWVIAHAVVYGAVPSGW
jgi:hypothetical protein